METELLKPGHKIGKEWRSDDIRAEENIDFSSLLLKDRVLKGLKRAGFRKPSPVQLKAIPLGRCGFDLIVQAKSGTGKTCVFAVVALEALVDIPNLQVVILAPTREVAVQICNVIRAIGCCIPKLKCHMFIGGTKVNEDVRNLCNCQIAVGTVGRLKHLIEMSALLTGCVRLLVLDEADKMLDSSLVPDLNFIYNRLPKSKQVLALSATYTPELLTFIQEYMRNPKFVRVSEKEVALKGVTQFYYVIPHHPMSNIVYKRKFTLLMKILRRVSFSQCLVFCNYITRVETLTPQLIHKGYPAEKISSSENQDKRLAVMHMLKTFKCRVLVSSDLTSRGIDCEHIDLVVNFDLPTDLETYLHRIGRAGRYGARAVAVTFICSGVEEQRLSEFEKEGYFDVYPLPVPLPGNLTAWSKDMASTAAKTSRAKCTAEDFLTVTKDLCDSDDDDLSEESDSSSEEKETKHSSPVIPEENNSDRDSTMKIVGANEKNDSILEIHKKGAFKSLAEDINKEEAGSFPSVIPKSVVNGEQEANGDEQRSSVIHNGNVEHYTPENHSKNSETLQVSNGLVEVSECENSIPSSLCVVQIVNNELSASLYDGDIGKQDDSSLGSKLGDKLLEVCVAVECASNNEIEKLESDSLKCEGTNGKVTEDKMGIASVPTVSENEVESLQNLSSDEMQSFEEHDICSHPTGESSKAYLDRPAGENSITNNYMGNVNFFSEEIESSFKAEFHLLEKSVREESSELVQASMNGSIDISEEKPDEISSDIHLAEECVREESSDHVESSVNKSIDISEEKYDEISSDIHVSEESVRKESSDLAKASVNESIDISREKPDEFTSSKDNADDATFDLRNILHISESNENTTDIGEGNPSAVLPLLFDKYLSYPTNYGKTYVDLVSDLSSYEEGCDKPEIEASAVSSRSFQVTDEALNGISNYLLQSKKKFLSSVKENVALQAANRIHNQKMVLQTSSNTSKEVNNGVAVKSDEQCIISSEVTVHSEAKELEAECDEKSRQGMDKSEQSHLPVILSSSSAESSTTQKQTETVVEKMQQVPGEKKGKYSGSKAYHKQRELLYKRKSGSGGLSNQEKDLSGESCITSKRVITSLLDSFCVEKPSDSSETSIGVLDQKYQKKTKIPVQSNPKEKKSRKSWLEVKNNEHGLSPNISNRGDTELLVKKTDVLVKERQESEGQIENPVDRKLNNKRKGIIYKRKLNSCSANSGKKKELPGVTGARTKVYGSALQEQQCDDKQAGIETPVTNSIGNSIFVCDDYQSLQIVEKSELNGTYVDQPAEIVGNISTKQNCKEMHMVVETAQKKVKENSKNFSDQKSRIERGHKNNQTRLSGQEGVKTTPSVCNKTRNPNITTATKNFQLGPAGDGKVFKCRRADARKKNNHLGDGFECEIENHRVMRKGIRNHESTMMRNSYKRDIINSSSESSDSSTSLDHHKCSKQHGRKRSCDFHNNHIRFPQVENSHGQTQHNCGKHNLDHAFMSLLDSVFRLRLSYENKCCRSDQQCCEQEDRRKNCLQMPNTSYCRCDSPHSNRFHRESSHRSEAVLSPCSSKCPFEGIPGPFNCSHGPSSFYGMDEGRVLHEKLLKFLRKRSCH